MGTEMSATESYQRTVSTWSTASIFSFRAATSLGAMFSTMTKENAPFPKSSIRVSCPMTVSMSSGR